MINLFPYKVINLQIPQSPNEIRQKLNDIVDHGFPFEGIVNHDNFCIRRKILYWNSFLPIIQGKMWEDGYKTTRMVVIFKLSRKITFFYFPVMFGGSLVISIGCLIQSWIHQQLSFSGILFSLALPTFFYTMALFGYSLELRFSLKIFCASLFENDWHGKW